MAQFQLIWDSPAALHQSLGKVLCQDYQLKAYFRDANDDLPVLLEELRPQLYVLFSHSRSPEEIQDIQKCLKKQALNFFLVEGEIEPIQLMEEILSRLAAPLSRR